MLRLSFFLYILTSEYKKIYIVKQNCLLRINGRVKIIRFLYLDYLRFKNHNNNLRYCRDSKSLTILFLPKFKLLICRDLKLKELHSGPGSPFNINPVDLLEL